MSLKFRFSALAVAGALVAAMMISTLASPARATSYYWDPTGTNSSNGGGGPANWDTTSNYWWNSGPDTAWSNATGAANTAVFGGASGGTVSVTVPITVGAITFNTAGYTLNGGTINLGNPTATNGTIITNQSATIGSAIAGTLPLLKDGPASLYLTNSANAFSGGVLLNGGTLNFVKGALNGNQVNCNGGTLQWASGNTQDVASLININNNSSQVAYLDTNTNNVTFGTGISGLGGVTKLGASVLTLTTNNTYTGPTTVSAGTLALTYAPTGNNPGALSPSSSVTINSGGTVIAGAFNAFGAGTSTKPTVTINAGGLLTTSANYYEGIWTINLNGGTLGAAGYHGAPTDGVGYGSWNFLKDVAVGGATTSTITAPGMALVQAGGVSFTVGANSVLNVPGWFRLNAPSSNYPLIKAGSGVMVLSGSNTYLAATNVNAGTLQIGNGGSGEALASQSISVSSGAILAFNNADALTISPSLGISGSGALVKFGGGTVTLGGTNNAYTGGTNVNVGVLTATNSGALPGFASVGKVSVAGGAVVAVPTTGWSQTDFDSLRTNASIPSGAYLGLDTSSGNATYSNSIALVGSGGAGGLAKVGGNTLTLSSTNNAYTGGTYVYGGILTATNSGALPGFASSGKVSAASGATVAVLLSGWAQGDIDALLAHASIPSGAYLGLDTSGGDATYAGSISLIGSGGVGGLAKVGGNALLLTGSNTYTSGTTIAGGTLELGGGGVLGGGSYGATIADNGEFVVSTSSNQTFGGVISGSGSLAKLGSGALTLNAANAYTGPTTVSGGTLVLNYYSGNTLSPSSAVTINSGGTVLASTRNALGTTSLPAPTITINAGGLLTTTPGNNNLYEVINTLNLNGGTLGAGGYDGNWEKLGLRQRRRGWRFNDIDHKRAGMALNKSTGVTFTVGASSLLNVPGWFRPTLGATYPLIKAGPGVMVLSGSNTYLAATNVNAGTLQIGNGASGEALASQSISVSSGAVLAFNNADTLTISPTAGIAGSGGVLVKFGSGTVVLGSTNNTYSGGTTINGGVLTATNSGALPGFASTGSVSVAGGAVVAVPVGGWSQGDFDALRTHASIPSGAYLGLDTSGGNATYANSIALIGIGGAGGLAKVGGNTLTLSSTNNTYTGGTYVNGGVLTATNSGALPGFASSGKVSVASGATVALLMSGWAQGDVDALRTNASIPSGAYLGLDTSGGDATYASSILSIGGGSAGGLAKVGGNVLFLTGSNTYAGGTLLGGGTLNFIGGALPLSGIAFGNGALQWANGNTQDVSSGLAAIPSGQTAYLDTNGNSVAFGTGIGGGGGLTKLGGGTLTLTTTNAYTGPTTVSAGTLALNYYPGLGNTGPAALSPSSAVTINSGGVVVAGTLNGLGGGTSNPTVTINAGGLLTTAGNLYAGLVAINLNGGTLGAGGYHSQFGSWWLQGNVTVGGSTTSTISAQNMVMQKYPGVTFTVGANSQLNVPGWFGRANEPYSYGLIKAGPGVMVLSGSNTYTTATSVNAGTLQIGNGTSGEALASQSISVSSGAVLAFNNADALTISPTGGITGNGALVKFGSGTVVLGSTNNAYSGGTTINGGMLTATNSGALPGFASFGSVSVAGGAVVAVPMSGWSQSDIDSLRIHASIPSGAYLGLDTSGGDATYASSIALIGSGGAGSLIKLGAGTLLLTGTNTYTGGTTVNNGILSLANTSALAGFPSTSGLSVASGATVAVRMDGWAQGDIDSLGANASIPSGAYLGLDTSGGDATYASAILSVGGGSAGGLAKVGGNVLFLTGSNTYTGGTLLGGGTLNFIGGALPAASPNIVFGGGALQWANGNTQDISSGLAAIPSGQTAKLDTNGNSVTFATGISGGGGLAKLGGGVLALTTTNAYTGPTTVNAGTLALNYQGSSSTPGTLNPSSAVTINSGGVVIAGTFNSFGGLAPTLYAPAVTINAGGLLTTAGAFYEGISVLNLNGGTLDAGGQQFSYGSWNLGGDVTVGGATTSTMSAPGMILLKSPGVTFTVGANSLLDVPGWFRPEATGFNGTLIKAGPGVMVLSGSNTYTADTTVNAGTLAVNGSLATSGSVHVYSTGALSGTGGVGNVAVHSGGILAPGYTAGAGTFTAASLTLDIGSALNYTLGAAASNCGYLNVAGALSLPGSGVTLNVLSSGPLGVGSYPLIGYTSLLTGGTSAFTTVNLSIPAGDTYGFSMVGNVLDLVISASSSLINGQWNVSSGGTWSAAGNWTGGVPGAHAQDTAVFGTILTSGTTATVTLDSSRTLASLGFSTTGANSYVIAPSAGSTLTLSNTTGTATISNSGGNHTIGVALTLSSNLSVTASTGSVLTIASAISESGSGRALTLSGDGELILSGTSGYTGGTTVSGGTLAMTAASALPSSGLVTISGGGRLVLGSGSGIGSLLAASAPIGSSGVALSGAAAPATLGGLENTSGNMATLGGAPALPLGGAESAVGATAAVVPEPGSMALLLVAGIAGLGAWRRKCRG